MARSQVNAHKKNILNEAKIPLQEIQSGTIVRFNYRGKDVHDPTPLVLVLNENWKNKLHGIALNVLTEGELYKLYKIVNVSLSEKMAKKLKLRSPIFKIKINNPKWFYKHKVKRLLKKISSSPYRTYTRSGISSVNIIDYRFKDMDIETQKALAQLDRKLDKLPEL